MSEFHHRHFFQETRVKASSHLSALTSHLFYTLFVSLVRCGADEDIAPVWLQLPCKLQKYKFTHTQHKLVLGRHTLAARKPLSSYNDKELFGCLSVCHTLPTLSQDPSDTGYLLTLRLPDGSNLPPPPPSLPPSKSPQCPVSRGWIEAASSLT